MMPLTYEALVLKLFMLVSMHFSLATSLAAEDGCLM